MPVGAGEATIGAIVLLMMMAAGGKKPKKGSQCSPFTYNEAEVQLSIGSAISAGMRGRQTIAIMVAQAAWPTTPDNKRQRLSWPPPPNASKAQNCVWKLLLAQIDKYLKDNGIPPWPDCGPGQTVDYAAQMCVDEEDQEPIPGGLDVEEYETPGGADYPTPGTLVQVRYGDRLLGKFSRENESTDAQGQALRSIAYTTLLTAGFMAAKEAGASDEAAGQFARDVAYDNNNRVDYVQLIQCSPWNDALYTTYGFSSKSWESPAGRSLRFLPNHYDNRERLIRGLAPKRNITLGSPSDKLSGNGHGQDSKERNFSYIWLPKINLQALWESGGSDITTEGVEWEDGSNGIMPPPEVLAYGVENVPESVSWGCMGFEASSL